MSETAVSRVRDIFPGRKGVLKTRGEGVYIKCPRRRYPGLGIYFRLGREF
jgi:hypothetical protein